LLAGAVVLWLLFALRMARAPEPFIPLAVLRAPILAATTAAGFFSVGVIIGLTIFMPVYFELVLGFSPSGSGTALIVFLAAATIGSFFAGRLMIQLTHYKLVPAVGMVLGIVMLAAFAWKPGGLSLLEVCGLLTIGGAGLGVMYPVTTTIVQNSVASHQLGTATGALNFARQLGGAIIVAAFATIVLGGIDSGGHGLTLDMLRGGAKLAGTDFALLFRWLFAAGAAFLAAGLVAVLLIEERPLRGPPQEPAS
jgi:MFS family permease